MVDARFRFSDSNGSIVLEMGTNRVGLPWCWFLCYGLGAILMIKAFALEKLSVAYPLMCASYVFALIYGYFCLGRNYGAEAGGSCVAWNRGDINQC